MATSFLQCLEASVAHETTALEIQLQKNQRKLAQMTLDEREDYILKLYCGKEITKYYEGVKTPDFGQILPRPKIKTGQKVIKMKVNNKRIMYNDEWSMPHSFESQSMIDLDLAELLEEGYSAEDEIHPDPVDFDQKISQFPPQMTSTPRLQNFNSTPTTNVAPSNNISSDQPIPTPRRRKPPPIPSCNNTESPPHNNINQMVNQTLANSANLNTIKKIKKIEAEVRHQRHNTQKISNPNHTPNPIVKPLNPEEYSRQKREIANNEKKSYTRKAHDVVIYGDNKETGRSNVLPDNVEAGKSTATRIDERTKMNLEKEKSGQQKQDFDFLINW